MADTPSLWVVVEDPHGRPVDGARVALAGVTRYLAKPDGPGRYRLPLDRPGDHQLLVARLADAGGFDHRTLRTTLFFRPPARGEPASLRAIPARPGELTGVTLIVAVDGGYEARVTLDYLWFTPVGAPPTLGNTVRVLIDGEEAWGDVAEALEAARESIHLTTWIYQPTLELRRPDPLAPAESREPFTIQDVLERRAAAGVVVRLLLWDAPFIDIPRDAARAAREPNDRFEVLQEANLSAGRLLRADEYPVLSALLGEHPLYSFHQKTIVIDGVLGYCGGMNLKENDWDSCRHELFDARRARFAEPPTVRSRIQAAFREADHPPRHDFMARVEGPAVAGLAANFRQRWEHLRENGAAYTENASAVSPVAPPSPCGGHAVQVVRTMPAPYDERGILDVYLRAIRAARRLIYIEDQYFRSTHVSDAIADAVRAWPELVVIVVTLRSYADDRLQGGWCWETFRRIRERRPDFELYTLEIVEPDRDGDVHVREVDIHAKLMLVDDVFLTVGSCNVNDRGFELEGEINLAVVDEALVRDTRLRLWREHLAGDPRLGVDLATDLRVWREHAEANRDVGGDTLRRSNVVPFTPVEREPVFDRDVW